jgi:hypothetical protein
MTAVPDRLAALCWLALAAIHASPAAVLFKPALLTGLYGIPPAGRRECCSSIAAGCSWRS